MAENQEELKSLLMRVKQETERAGLKLNIKKTKIKVSGPVQFSSTFGRVWLFASPWTAACQSSLSITNFQSLLKLMYIKSVITSNHLILCCPLLLPSILPIIRVFFNKSVPCIRWLKYWSFSFSISPSNEYSGLISFRIDWFDLLVAQGTLKSLLQHYSSKTSCPIASCQIEGGNVEEVTNFLFLGSKITADGDWSHKIRCLLLGRKTVTNVDSVLKSGDITLLTKVHVVKAMVFPVVIYVVRTGP